MKPNHREFTRWNHGNGLFHYAPNLAAPSGDSGAGAESMQGLAPGDYTIDCDGPVENVFIRIEKPSGAMGLPGP